MKAQLVLPGEPPPAGVLRAQTPQKKLREATEPRKAGNACVLVYLEDGVRERGSVALSEVVIVVSLGLFLDIALSFASAVYVHSE